ncbi:MAG: hypothetical protein WC375_00050 [Methanomassiliicoccales archaeon]|jgi:hypothetical protein
MIFLLYGDIELKARDIACMVISLRFGEGIDGETNVEIVVTQRRPMAKDVEGKAQCKQSIEQALGIEFAVGVLELETRDNQPNVLSGFPCTEFPIPERPIRGLMEVRDG